MIGIPSLDHFVVENAFTIDERGPSFVAGGRVTYQAFIVRFSYLHFFS